MNELPNKLSELIELAVRDVQACEADPRYILNMGRWHAPRNGGCEVCMAGAVMAQTLRVPLHEELWAWVDGDKKHDRLPGVDMHRGAFLAINDARVGKLLTALKYLKSDDLSAEQHEAAEGAEAVIVAELPSIDGDDGDDGDGYDGYAPWQTYIAAAAILRGAGL